MASIGMIDQDLIVRQLTHVAALQGVTPDELATLDDDGWARLAGIACGLDRADIRAEVIRLARQQART